MAETVVPSLKVEKFVSSENFHTDAMVQNCISQISEMGPVEIEDTEQERKKTIDQQGLVEIVSNKVTTLHKNLSDHLPFYDYISSYTMFLAAKVLNVITDHETETGMDVVGGKMPEKAGRKNLKDYIKNKSMNVVCSSRDYLWNKSVQAATYTPVRLGFLATEQINKTLEYATTKIKLNNLDTNVQPVNNLALLKLVSMWNPALANTAYFLRKFRLQLQKVRIAAQEKLDFTEDEESESTISADECDATDEVGGDFINKLNKCCQNYNSDFDPDYESEEAQSSHECESDDEEPEIRLPIDDVNLNDQGNCKKAYR